MKIFFQSLYFIQNFTFNSMCYWPFICHFCVYQRFLSENCKPYTIFFSLLSALSDLTSNLFHSTHPMLVHFNDSSALSTSSNPSALQPKYKIAFAWSVDRLTKVSNVCRGAVGCQDQLCVLRTCYWQRNFIMMKSLLNALCLQKIEVQQKKE